MNTSATARPPRLRPCVLQVPACSPARPLARLSISSPTGQAKRDRGALSLAPLSSSFPPFSPRIVHFLPVPALAARRSPLAAAVLAVRSLAAHTCPACLGKEAGERGHNLRHSRKRGARRLPGGAGHRWDGGRYRGRSETRLWVGS
jgi:hypothetical protein